MAEYIEREALMAYAHQQPGGFISDISIQFFPAADVVEVRHGRWMPTPEYDSCWCSRCKKQYTGFFAVDWNYCPNCGARMDLEV